MNKVQGKILLQETNVGIANLLVTIYDLDTQSLPKELIQTKPMAAVANFWDQLQGDRLGSVLTNEDGVFGLEYEDGEFQVDKEEKRPDLVLFVTAPEKQGTESCATVLHVSCGIRQHAGKTESYVIQLTVEQLKEAGVPLPQSLNQQPEDPVQAVKFFFQAQEANEIRDQEIRAFYAQRVDKLKARFQGFEQQLKPLLLQTLSSVPDDTVTSATFVASGESIKETGETVIKGAINDVFNRTTLTGQVRLTQEQKQKLTNMGLQDNNGSFVNIPGEAFETMLFGPQASDGRSTVLMKHDPITRMCRKQTLGQKCLEGDEDAEIDADQNGDAEENEDQDTAGDGVDMIKNEDIPRYVASLIDTITSPEESVSFGVTRQKERANQIKQEVQDNVDTFLLKRGPADVPAFFDFHNLQIAFDHVWQEAIDEDILKLSEDAYKEIVELGGDPCSSLLTGSPRGMVDIISCFEREIEFIKPMYYEEPHPEVSRAFNVTREQWSVLNETLRTVLRDKISIPILLQDADALEPNSHGYRLRTNFRRQGQRILEYADSLIVKKSDPFSRLHKILKALRQRIKEDYPFTIYAANRQERSVNFGTLVTYRQKWDPVSYQAGELVNTITLAPNEVRKFSKLKFPNYFRPDV